MKKLYAKFFDVDWDEATSQPVPHALVEIDTALLSGLEIVPAVFITNRTLMNLPIEGMDSLAHRIILKTKELARSPIEEIQLDCDWTERTRDKYFALLNATRRFALADSSVPYDRPDFLHPSSFIISATIRLHQFKYPEKTGVPPVDRGMLMCYNMGELEVWETENSILDNQNLTSYLSPTIADPYPLPLDFALPIFRWGVLFRDGRMIKLLNNLDSTDLWDSNRFLKTATNRYEVVQSTYLNAHYLYKGDQIRLEATTPTSVIGLARTINSKVATLPTFKVAFFHLDTTTIHVFPTKKITEVLHQF